MDILKFLQSKKILPSKDFMVESEAKKLAKKVASNNYYLMDLDNKELSDFANAFNNEILSILAERFNSLSDELVKTEKALNNIK